MEMRNITKSSAFVVTVFVLVAMLLPFALEQIGEATDMFKFPATKTVKGWFLPGDRGFMQGSAAVKPVDWERYRRDLEEFSIWAAFHSCASISLPPKEVVVPVVADCTSDPEQKMWLVPVAGCTPGDPAGGKKGYVFMSGLDRPFEEGSFIAPSDGLCGYEIVSIGERSVWFRVVSGADDSRMGVARFPDFARVLDDGIVRGGRKYVARDAFPLSSGGWLMLDSFMPPDGAVFKILNENRIAVATILCIVIGEKGGPR